MQDSWRERVGKDTDLLSLGNHQPKWMSLSSDGDGGGGGQQLPWNVSDSPKETSNGSSSSAVISHLSHNVEEQNSDQSGCVLKEHDYISMAEISSAASAQSLLDAGNSQELNWKETDLCLGLGLVLAPSTKVEPLEEDTGKTIAFALSQQQVTKSTADPAVDVKHNATVQKSVQTSWPNAHIKTVDVDNSSLCMSNGGFQPSQICLSMQDVGSAKAGAPRAGTVFPGGSYVVPPPASKNGVKRGYNEAMSDAARFNMASEAAMVVKNGDADVKAPPKHPQSSFLPGWAPSKPMVPSPWYVALEQSAAHPFSGASKPSPGVIAPRVDKPVVDCAATAYKGSHNQSETAAHDSAIDEAPPPKGQVVGWPPIRSYRKNTLAKPSEMFVKVNMDGVTVGRKVDLNAHNSYEGLLSTLEEMFQPSNTAQGGPQAACGNDTKQFRLLNGSDYVLTYEDKDGDWMLVGDVPWSMFSSTVRRLRITRGPEATGLGPRGSEKLK